MHHISASDVNVMMGTTLVNLETFTLNIEDGSTAVKTRGISHGWVNGETSASGEITVDTENLKLMIDVAKTAGSFQSMPLVDVICSAKTVDQSLKIAAYGCKITMSKVLEAGKASGNKLEHTLPFVVTDKRFVEIDGTPYLGQDRVGELGD
ncbi:DUF2597 family protein [Marinomonas sp. RSW2]|uniref:DUF2597 family protein n=1 Tax=Marinomonas maritima TaxID=2940935 RepID=A0ABT5WHL3_9GAMM|nr:phage protein [Marinomonas maritima]MDE8603899.1 DUF2597 family protein [Marinomonas maritima]